MRKLISIAVVACALSSLFLALLAACSGGVVRKLFEDPQERTVFQIQDFKLTELPAGGGVYQFWLGTADENLPLYQFVVVGSSLWPPEYLDYDPEDLPGDIKSLGTLTNTEIEIDLPEDLTVKDIDAVYLTIEPPGEDDGIMSQSILLSGGLNVRGRANMAFDATGERGGLPDVFSVSGKLMLAIPTNREPVAGNGDGEASALPRLPTADGDETPPEWITGYGIISAEYNVEATEITVTFGDAQDADSPPETYVLYWQDGTSIDFADDGVQASAIELDITGQDEAPFTYVLDADDISVIGGVISLAVHARDSADPPNETPQLDPHPEHPYGTDWLTVATSDIFPPVWVAESGIISATYNELDSEITITFGMAEDADSPPVSYIAYWQAGSEIDFLDSTVIASAIELDISGQEEPPYTATMTSTEIPEIGEAISLAVHARDSAEPFNETPVLDPHPDHASGRDWLTAVPGDPYYKGIWFVAIPDEGGEPVASLDLPDLTDVTGWEYEAWAYKQDEQILLSLGRFKNPLAQDFDGAGDGAGQGPPYEAPGSDFLTSSYDFRDVNWEFYITVEPSPDTSPAGFAWKILSAGAKVDLGPNDALDLEGYTGNPPFGVARVL
ncbi:hypothetical protein J7K50_07675 [bacterium]|nr:hypothetical protein [bacterium]